jgi:hypothetical protein
MELPAGAVATQAWLETIGVYRQLTHRYLASGWLEKLGHGAFIRSGDSVDWLGAVYALQEQLKLKVHIAADTALHMRGLGHFLPLGEKMVVHLFGGRSTSLPGWFTRHAWDVQIRYHQNLLFDGPCDAGFSTIESGRFGLLVAAPERAILETIQLATSNASLEHAAELMNGLTTLRPDEVQTLLEACRSIRVKRFFLWSAAASGHAWFNKIKLDNIHLGSGKRQMFKSGAYDATYRITIPPLKTQLPHV